MKSSPNPAIDPAEAWLMEHDLDYATSRLSWRHVRGERYAFDEEPKGTAEEIEQRVVLAGKGSWITKDDTLSERTCADKGCERSFMPRQHNQWFCTVRCYQRVYMRHVRRGKREP